MNENQKGGNNTINALAYLLFFLPLVIEPKTEEGRFHANQGLVLLIFGIIVSILGGLIPFIGWLIILPVGSIAVIVFAIMGIISALNGETKELPLIGKIRLIK